LVASPRASGELQAYKTHCIIINSVLLITKLKGA
jgi:hypothetical protein